MQVGMSVPSNVNIVISEFMEPAAVALLQARHRVMYEPGAGHDLPRLAELVMHCDALIVREHTPVNQDLIALATELSVVGRLSGNASNIDMAACVARNIAVLTVEGTHAVPVSEYVIGAILNMRRNVFGLSEAVAAGQWPHKDAAMGGEVHGQRLGLVGFGQNARQTALLARTLGMQIVAYDPALAHNAAIWQLHGARPSDLAALLAQSDVVSVHLPAVASTRGMLGAAQIALMKPGAMLINTSHGGIVDEVAVVAALKSGRLGGAAFDVFAQEPLPAGSVWHDAPNAMLTPHVAGLTLHTGARASELMARKVLAHFEL
jgi:(S)-sulfolactate dehydrogenase